MIVPGRAIRKQRVPRALGMLQTRPYLPSRCQNESIGRMPHSQIGVIERSTGRALPAAPAGAVLRSSAGLGWQGLAVELHRLGPSEMPEHIIDQHRLLIHVGQPVLFEWQEEGRWRSTRLHPGSFNLQGILRPSPPREVTMKALSAAALATLVGLAHPAAAEAPGLCGGPDRDR